MPIVAVQTVPPFFRRCVESPRIRSYFIAGYYLATEACTLGPPCDEPWLDELYFSSELGGAALVNWMEEALPACMALVPKSGLPTFIVGVDQALMEGMI